MSLTSTPRLSAGPIEILLVEDDDDDVRLIRKSLENDRLLNHIQRVEDGLEAMEYLRCEGRYVDAKRPGLILLDLNMPRMCGREVLRAIKNDPQLCRIPVVVLTTSDDEKDVVASYEYQANSYVTKPVDLDKFREVLKGLKDYWFSIVKLPPCSQR